MYRLTTLDNGLRIITGRMPAMHSLAIGMWIKTGGRYESSRQHGVSHFMEHMLFKGTGKRSCQQIKQAIEERGGVFNAFTSEEVVCYYVKTLSQHLDLAADVLSDMILNSSLRKEDIEKERRVIFEELRMYLDLPMQHVHDLLDELIWPEHPLGRSLLGTYKTIGAVQRNDLLRLKDQFHRPNNIIVACCGNVDHDHFIETIDALFKRCRSRKIAPFKKTGPALPKLRTNFYHKATEQTHICLGVRALSRRHPQRYALSLLSTILGGNMSSRLFNEIREKRSLAYEIGTSIKQYADTGSFFIHAGIDNRKVKEAISVIMGELKKIKKASVTKREFSMAKEYYKSGLLMSLEHTMSSMLFLGEQIASVGKIDTMEKILQDLDKVDIDMVNQVADRLFSDRSLKLAIIGPQDEKAKAEIEGLLHLQ